MDGLSLSYKNSDNANYDNDLVAIFNPDAVPYEDNIIGTSFLMIYN